MTRDKFLNELQRVHNQFDWKLSADESPMAEQRSKPRLVLSATPKTEQGTVALDPVAAVCYAHTGHIQSLTNATEALGMELSDSAAMVAASRDNTYSGPDGQRKPVDELIAIRKRLLEIVGETVERGTSGL